MNQNGINNNEVQQTSGIQSVKIGELVQPKQRKTPLIMFFVILLFAAAVFFLPDIDAFIRGVGKTNNPDQSSSSSYVFVNNNNEFFILSEASKIIIDNHVLTGFKVNSTSNTLDYRITNYNPDRTSIDNKNWYISFFDEAKTILSFRKLSGPLLTPPNQDGAISFDFSVDLNGEDASVIKYIKIGQISDDEYPSVTLRTDENNEQYLACIKGESNLTYYFTDDKLHKIAESYSTARSAHPHDYEIIHQTYKTKSANLATNENFTSEFVDGVDNFTYKATIDLRQSNYSSFDENYLKRDTSSRLANFVIESRGYDCQ